MQWPEGERAGTLMLVSALTCTSDSRLPPPQRCPTLLIAPVMEVKIPDRVKDIQDRRWSLSETKSGWRSEVRGRHATVGVARMRNGCNRWGDRVLRLFVLYETASQSEDLHPRPRFTLLYFLNGPIPSEQDDILCRHITCCTWTKGKCPDDHVLQLYKHF